MKRNISISNKILDIEILSAKVIHANKYSTAMQRNAGEYSRGGSTTHQEVVFRLTESSIDWSIKLQDIEVPLYTSQELLLIRCNMNLIGFRDDATNRFYPISNNMANDLGLVFPYILIWIIGIIGFLILIKVLGVENSRDFFSNSKWLICLLPFIITWSIHKLLSVKTNSAISKQIRRVLNEL